MMRWFLLSMIGWIGLAHAEVPPQRLEVLRRGVNVTTVFDMDSNFTQLIGDMPTIARYGFRHIRIFVAPDWVLQWSKVSNAKRAHLDQVVRAAVDHNLGVILCMSGIGANEWRDGAKLSEVQSRWTAAWKQLARQYRTAPVDRMFYELVNEPALSSVARWATIQTEMLRQVRTVAPQNTLLLTSTPDSTVWGLAQLMPVKDDNVVYAFHLYQPMVFTHQGAEWSDPAYAGLTGLVYPPEQANVATIRGKVPAALAGNLANYELDGKYAIETEVVLAVQWARNHRTHVIVTEFGVYRPAPERSRAAWLNEARRSVEQAGFGWSIWEWSAGFGVRNDLAKGCAPDSIRQALGFCP